MTPQPDFLRSKNIQVPLGLQTPSRPHNSNCPVVFVPLPPRTNQLKDSLLNPVLLRPETTHMVPAHPVLCTQMLNKHLHV
jgi:hypothetical protein